MTHCLWDVAKQTFENSALYSSEEKAFDYAGRVQRFNIVARCSAVMP